MQLMRLAVGLAFRETSKAARNKWRGAALSFLERCRVSASAAAQRLATGERTRGGQSRRRATEHSPAADAAGGRDQNLPLPTSRLLGVLLFLWHW